MTTWPSPSLVPGGGAARPSGREQRALSALGRATFMRVLSNFLLARLQFFGALLLLLALGLPLAATAQPIAVHDLAVLVDADGIETIASVSAPGAAQRIRQWEAQTRCLGAGMDAVLSKPVLQGDLWASLAKWLPAVLLAPQRAPIPVVLKAVDPVAIIGVVNEVLPLLAQGKADARDRFKVLQGLVAGSELAPEMADVDLPLKQFRFDLTLDRLRAMAS